MANKHQRRKRYKTLQRLKDDRISAEAVAHSLYNALDNVHDRLLAGLPDEALEIAKSGIDLADGEGFEYDSDKCI